MIELLSSNQLFLIATALVFLIASVVLNFYEKHHYSVFFLVASGISLFSFSSLLDPFLNLWDERFHALVAKNMMEHPLIPTLYDNAIVNMAYEGWDKSIVWLHKQPLFLWQIALSFKLFGISEFTLRLPSIVLLSAAVYAVFRTGRLLVNYQVGYLASVLFISSFYILELVAGRQQLDVNDAAFLGYVSLSIWCLLEYLYSRNKKWLYIIGLFSGAAILCKWLVGLLVYLIWGLFKLLNKEWQPKQQLDIIASLAVTIATALPWQIYSHLKFPLEASEEMAYNSAHFFTAIEGHEESWFYHFEQLNNIYGSFTIWAIVPALITFWVYSKYKKQSLAFILSLLFIYIFFSVAATKMPSFTIVGAPIIFTALAAAIWYPFDWICNRYNLHMVKKLSFVMVVLILVLTRIDLQAIQQTHFNSDGSNEYVNKLSSNKLLFKSLNLPENAVLLNVKGRHYIEAMFYTGIPAYNFIPEKSELKRLIKNGKILYVFKDEADLSHTGEELNNYTVINNTVQGWD